jgi:16S rRNA C967 or C1407 C5-methylase (RsmB/RsmF family)
MSAGILNEVFADFCESRVHLDSLLSKVEPTRKSKVAQLLGAFLRRPWAISTHFGITLAESSPDFFDSSFIRLKKNAAIHETLKALWSHSEGIPNEGSRLDFPEAMVGEWEHDWGADTADQLCKLLSQDPLTTIRFHRKAFGSDGALLPEVQAWLRSESLPKSRTGNFMASARVFRGYAGVQQNEFFKNGFFEIQDEGSQLMAAFSLFPKEIGKLISDRPVTGARQSEAFSVANRAKPVKFVDACAGAGGKTLAVSDLMSGKGQIFAYDIFGKKLRGLKQRIDRAGDRNVKPLHVTGPEAILEFSDSADVVLVDAPCSGLGVSRRNPDAKWNRKPLDSAKQNAEKSVQELQSEVLDAYAGLVKAGGRLVYGVCTFGKSETSDQVARFLASNPRFSLEGQGFIGPRDTDGFFMASLVKSNA